MSCEDCIHYDICIFHIKGDENKKCKHFKNKANMTEVVRCKDCTHSQYSKGIGYICEYDNKCRHGMNYCSEGEPREESMEESIVVRCKDCKYFGTSLCAMDTYTFDVVEEGFCSYGERKEQK